MEEQFGKECKMFSNGWKDQKESGVFLGENMVIGDEGSRTVDCLRGRLLAERVNSKAAKEEAELMGKRVTELEMQLKLEIESRKRAEKKLKMVMKKLNSMKLSTVSDQLVSLENSSHGSSITSLSESQESEEQRSNFETSEPSSEKHRSNSSDTVMGGSVLEENSHGEESSSSGENGDTQNHASPAQEQGKKSNIDSGEQNHTDFHRTSLVVRNRDRGKDKIEYEESQLALAPIGMWPDSKASAKKLDNNIHDVLVALRHAKRRLQTSIRGSGAIYSRPFELYGIM